MRFEMALLGEIVSSSSRSSSPSPTLENDREKVLDIIIVLEEENVVNLGTSIEVFAPPPR